MTETKLEMIKEFGRQVEKACGAAVYTRVMSGAEALTPKTGATDISLWVRDAINRLDASVPGQERVTIMQNCGFNCARRNATAINSGKTRRAKFNRESAFLAAEVAKPQVGTRLEQQGSILIQTYTPQSFTHPMRCYCGLLDGLPASQQVSPTYCNCSRAFVQAYWSKVLGLPVKVKVLETAVTGATECKFEITI